MDLDENLNNDVEIEDSLFVPLYENASITQCGAYCALMEFKRSCRLPFTTIAKLLDLLQLLCPPNNNLPQSVYKFKKFFTKFSTHCEKRNFCRVCHVEYKDGQKKCNTSSCRLTEADTLVNFDSKTAIRRVLKSKSE